MTLRSFSPVAFAHDFSFFRTERKLVLFVSERLKTETVSFRDRDSGTSTTNGPLNSLFIRPTIIDGASA